MRIWEKPEWQEKFLALYRQGWTDVRIAAAMGNNASCVGEGRRALGLHSHAGRGPNLRALKAETPVGKCLACGESLPPGKSKCCGEEECLAVMLQAYAEDKAWQRQVRHRLRKVVGASAAAKKGPAKLLQLECGHEVQLPWRSASKHAWCTACAARPEAA